MCSSDLRENSRRNPLMSTNSCPFIFLQDAQQTAVRVERANCTMQCQNTCGTGVTKTAALRRKTPQISASTAFRLTLAELRTLGLTACGS